MFAHAYILVAFRELHVMTINILLDNCLISLSRSQCFPITIPDGDHRFKEHCMSFVRATPGLDKNCDMGKWYHKWGQHVICWTPRQQWCPKPGAIFVWGSVPSTQDTSSVILYSYQPALHFGYFRFPRDRANINYMWTKRSNNITA